MVDFLVDLGLSMPIFDNNMNQFKQHADSKCVLIGTSDTVYQLFLQLQTLTDRPRMQGVFLFQDEPGDKPKNLEKISGLRILGTFKQFERLIAPFDIDYAIVTMPAVMTDAITAIRTKLRRMGIPDRFIATLDDHLHGVGPRMVFEVDPVNLIKRKPYPINEDAIRQSIYGKRVLITGAGGSIGSELALTVARFEPAELFLMERSENALFEIDRRIARAKPKIHRGTWLHDVTDADKTLAYCVATRPQVIFHTAAHKHVPMMEDHPAAAVHNNFFGTMAIADAAAHTGCDRFVMISTDKAVNPSSIMGATKRFAELYVQHMNQISDTRFEMVRFGNVLGSAGSVLTIWSDQIRDGGPLTVTDPEMTRYFMTIPEAAALVLQAAALQHYVSGGEVKLLDMGEPIGILDMAKRFIRSYGLEPYVPGVDDARLDVEDSGLSGKLGHGNGYMPIIFSGIRPGEKIHEELSYNAECMIPTEHPGIHIWETTYPSSEMVADMVATLTEACETKDAETVLTAIHRLLPEMSVSGNGGVISNGSGNGSNGKGSGGSSRVSGSGRLSDNINTTGTDRKSTVKVA